MHGNPANSLYGGIKVAACGELGMGVGEEERGSGEREVLEGFVGRIEGLVDVIVSRFGDIPSANDSGMESSKKETPRTKPTSPWLGSGNELGAEDGVIFLGTGAVSRKSLRDISHWVEDLYRWGPYAYGVLDNPTSTRRPKKPRQKQHTNKKELFPDARKKSKQVYGLAIRDKPHQNEDPPQEGPMVTIPPMPIRDGDSPSSPKSKRRRPSFHRVPSSYTSTDSESSKSNKFVSYLKLGYGTHWSLGGIPLKNEGAAALTAAPRTEATAGSSGNALPEAGLDGTLETSASPDNDSFGHYMIGLMGDIENEDGEISEAEPQIPKVIANVDEYNTRLVL
jgi:hypothetical protein